MIHLALPPMASRRLPFYLAMEEWAARTLPPGEYFFSWRVKPTVICGRNQEMDKEIDLEYCRREGIDIVRRRSGGGAVYADMENFMFSYITSGNEIQSVFSHYTVMISEMLRALGIGAEPTGRNDILINGQKVAGNAFYHLPGRCIVHGTMLYDFDPSTLQRVLTPSRAKLESKGVKSAPQRVTSLKAQGIGLSPEEFGRFAVEYLCQGNERTVGPDDIAEIEAIEKKYYEPDFLREHRQESGKEPDILRHSFVDGVGEFDTAVNLKPDNTIAGVGLWGDFFVIGDINADLLQPLEGVSYDRSELAKAIDALEPSAVIKGLTKPELLNILI